MDVRADGFEEGDWVGAAGALHFSVVLLVGLRDDVERDHFDVARPKGLHCFERIVISLFELRMVLSCFMHKSRHIKMTFEPVQKVTMRSGHVVAHVLEVGSGKSDIGPGGLFVVAFDGVLDAEGNVDGLEEGSLRHTGSRVELPG